MSRRRFWVYLDRANVLIAVILGVIAFGAAIWRAVAAVDLNAIGNAFLYLVMIVCTVGFVISMAAVLRGWRQRSEIDEATDKDIDDLHIDNRRSPY